MSLSLTANFVHTQNQVLPLAQSSTKPGLAVRVASTSSGTLGSLTALNAAETPTWAIAQNPSWITIAPSSDGITLTLNFVNAAAQAYPYQFYVSCTDGVSTTYFPIFLEVKDPLRLAIAATGGTTITAASYDSTVADQVIQGLGVNSIVDAGVSFLLPPSLPSGLQFVTSDMSKLVLRVADATASNLSGGLALFTTSPVTTQVNIGAYKPGTMYDNPSRAFLQPFTVESLSTKPGIPDLGLAVQALSNGNFQLNASVDFLAGQAQGVVYEWVVGGTAAGAVTSGGTPTSLTMVWAASAVGYVTFTFKVKNAATNTTLAQVYVNPLLTGTASGIPCSNASTWTSSNAIKLILGQNTVTGAVGTQQQITVSTPAGEFNSSETITLTLTTVAASTLEAAATTTVNTLTLTAAAPSATLTLPIPSSGIRQKWMVGIAAANAASSPTRTGYAQAVVISSGLPAMVVASASGNTLTSNVGQSITPVVLTATFNGSPVSGVSYSLLHAPDGLSISGASLVGNVRTPGSYSFTLIAEATGFARSYSAVIALTASTFATPLTISDPLPVPASLPDGQQFQVNWGTSGIAATLNFIQNFNVRSVLGATSTLASQSGNSVLSIYGGSFYGDAYSIPALALSSSIVASGTLLNAPTIAVIDEFEELIIHWQPLPVNGNYQAYKGFNIWLTSLPFGAPQLQTFGGVLPTGLEVTGATPDSRIYQEPLAAGDYTLNMQALSSDATVALNAGEWDNAHEFPTAITSASASFDNPTVDLGQPVNITLDPNYGGSDTWCVTYPDGTSSGWLPLSIKTVAKAFTTAGTIPVIIQTERDYSNTNPGVRLRRQVTLSMYVMDQQFQTSGSTSELTGNLGFGGDAGFEITDASTSSVGLVPYAVVLRALVRDTMTNEWKLMVAAARTADSSSLLGTMALDVFPILGRPRTLEPIDPALYLSAEQVKTGSPVRIATTLLPNAVVGKPLVDFQMQATTGTGVAPFSWYADTLPFGMKLSINGVLSGTPMLIASYVINFSVIDSNDPAFISNATLTLIVESDLLLPTNQSLATATVGTAYQAQVAATGGIPPLTWEIASGNPPVGITIDPDSGNLIGVPVSYNSTTDFQKTYSFTVQAIDSIGAVASAALNLQIQAAALGLGPIDQSEVFADQQFRLIIPVVGGKAPYALVKFDDDGTIGSGLAIANPSEIDVSAGIAPPTLALTVANQAFYPQKLPVDPAIVLSASGGQPPYTYSIPNPRIYAKTALSRATIYGGLLLSTPSTSQSYAIEVAVTDQRGHQAQTLLNVDVFQKGWNGYTLQPVRVATNGSTNPANFTITALTGIPDAQKGSPYNGGANIYYGVALYLNNVLHMTQTAGGDGTPMNFTFRSGTLPPGIVAFSANSFGQSTDYSGLMLFNVSGGSNPATNGSWSFETEFSNIRGVGGVVLPIAVGRSSITVSTSGGGSTPVVVVTTTQDLNLDLSRVSGTPYAWYYPLAAEGGTAPYTFHIVTGSTLPVAQLTNNTATMFYSSTGTVFLNGQPLDATNNSAPINAVAFASNSVLPGTYVMTVTATDVNGIKSVPSTVNVFVTQSPTEPIHIVNQNLPAYLYTGQTLPANIYFVEADLVAVWQTAALPAGLTLSATSGTKAYLSGTPTAIGPASVTFTAMSTAFNTTASLTVNLPILARTAVFLSPPTSATVGISYRASNSNAILSVQYTGYQPGDPALPLVTSAHGTVGAPGLANNGTPTVAVSHLTADGFVLAFDYTCPVVGNDTVTLTSAGIVLQTLALPVVYVPLSVAGTTISVTVSEYSASSLAAPPVTASGGLAPYTYTPIGFSDPRFTSGAGGQIAFNPAAFNAGQTYPCSVSIQVADASGQTVTAVGTLTVTIRAEQYVQANFTPGVFNLKMNGAGSPAGVVKTYVPIVSMVTPVLGHTPFQVYTDAISFAPPTGTIVGSTLANAYASLQQLLQVSPTQNVLFVSYGAAAASGGAIFDETSARTQGTLIGQASALATTAALPPSGTYRLAVLLRVVDADAYSTSATGTLTVVITP
jgi:hypothetical protein